MYQPPRRIARDQYAFWLELSAEPALYFAEKQTWLAEKCGRNAGQILLRFEVQDGLIVLPKFTNPERFAGSLRIFDFELTEGEMDQMDALDTGRGHHDPEAPGVAEMLLQNDRIRD